MFGWLGSRGYFSLISWKCYFKVILGFLGFLFAKSFCALPKMSLSLSLFTRNFKVAHIHTAAAPKSSPSTPQSILSNSLSVLFRSSHFRAPKFFRLVSKFWLYMLCWRNEMASSHSVLFLVQVCKNTFKKRLKLFSFEKAFAAFAKHSFALEMSGRDRIRVQNLWNIFSMLMRFGWTSSSLICLIVALEVCVCMLCAN